MNRHDAGVAVELLAPFAVSLSVASAEAAGLPLDAGPLAVEVFTPHGSKCFATLEAARSWAANQDHKRRRRETQAVADSIAQAEGGAL